jgi:hypothetical protein
LLVEAGQFDKQRKMQLSQFFSAVLCPLLIAVLG